MDSNGLILCGRREMEADEGTQRDKLKAEGFAPRTQRTPRKSREHWRVSVPRNPFFYRRGPIRRFKPRGLLNSTAPRDRRPSSACRLLAASCRPWSFGNSQDLPCEASCLALALVAEWPLSLDGGSYLPLPKSITWMVLSIVLQSKSREK